MCRKEPLADYNTSPHKILTSHIEAVIQDSTLAQIVETPNIVDTVMNEVGQTQSNIIMTMHLKEELEQPLPERYHQLLASKLTEGIQITRLGFGTLEDYQQIAKKHDFHSGNFTFKHNPNLTQYQRMILIDGKTLLFNYKGTFFRSNHLSTINEFQEYFRAASKEINNP